MALPRIQRNMDVVSSRSELVGIVESIDGDELRLARDAAGQEHRVPLAWIHFTDDQVHLERTANDVVRLWSGETFE